MITTEFKLEFEVVGSEVGGKTTAVIVAAGSSARMGRDKQLLPLLGKPVLAHSIEAFENSRAVDNIVVVTAEDRLLEVQKLIKSYGFQKVTDIVAGGETRAQSVKNGIAAIGLQSDIVLIHDGARPLVTSEITEAVKNAAELFGAAVPVVPVKDTVKEVDDSGHVVKTPKRSRLFAAQTPQGFRLSTYREALEKIQKIEDFYDDSQLLEAAGFPVYTVKGSYENIKITVPGDLPIAEEILKNREKRSCE